MRLTFHILFTTFSILASFIKFAESACSTDSFRSVQNYDGTKILGRWYTTSRFSNGNDESECLWIELKFTSKARNAVIEIQHRVYNNKTSNRRQTAILTYADANRDPPEGIVNVQFLNGVHMIKYIPVVEYNEYYLVRSCYKEEGIIIVIYLFNYVCKLFNFLIRILLGIYKKSVSV